MAAYGPRDGGRRDDHAPAVRIDRNLPFAAPDTGELLLDLYRPRHPAEPLPVVVWLYGGGWLTGDRTLQPDPERFVCLTGRVWVWVNGTELLLTAGDFLQSPRGNRAQLRYRRATPKCWGC